MGMEHAQRWTLGAMQHPVRGLLHGSATLAALVAAIWLVARSPSGGTHRLALAVFGGALVCLFAVSTLYHSVPWPDRWKRRMLRIDNSAIFVFIAGTYTPIAVIVFDGWLTWATLGAAWGISLLGVAQLAFFPRPTTALSLLGYVIEGWMGVVLLVPLAQRLPWTAILLALAGGVLYSIGLMTVVTRRPRLWPRVFSYHEVFHVLVIAGSAAHFVLTARWVARFAGAA